MSLILQSKTAATLSPTSRAFIQRCAWMSSTWGWRTEVPGAAAPGEQGSTGVRDGATDGRRKNCVTSKTFTASLHPKAKLAEFLGKWRGAVSGREHRPGETHRRECTLVVSHQQNMVGRTYASIDAVSKPTKKLTPPALRRCGRPQRIAEWKAKEQAAERPGRMSARPSPFVPDPCKRRGSPTGRQPEAQPQSAAAPKAATAARPQFDPEVGF